MALAYRTMYKNCYYLHSITKPVKWSIGRNYSIRVLASGVCYQNSYLHRPLIETQQINLFSKQLRLCSTKQGPGDKTPQENEVKPPGLIQKFKQMYKDYWYVVLPVHMATSCVWFGGFYYFVRSGVDVVSLLTSLGISETIISPLRDSGAGYFALALALYKLVTPLRYAVTVGVTTIAIKRLTAIGWLKPVPSRERLKEIYQEKKVNIQDRINEGKQQYNTMKEKRKVQVMEEMKRYKEEMRSMKNKMQRKE
ncbi:uncharacterized protein C18orf19 homolog A [Anticarsia gemmatalis]|uniref:uncharacterized protein C18orf19 homolog A n=1 Tax=Anticarsia gemmatalis TaxID=129554 RepID=UPI003F763013